MKPKAAEPGLRGLQAQITSSLSLPVNAHTSHWCASSSPLPRAPPKQDPRGQKVGFPSNLATEHNQLERAGGQREPALLCYLLCTIPSLPTQKSKTCTPSRVSLTMLLVYVALIMGRSCHATGPKRQLWLARYCPPRKINVSL